MPSPFLDLDCDILSQNCEKPHPVLEAAVTVWELMASQILQGTPFWYGLTRVVLNLTSGLPLSAAPRVFCLTCCILVLVGLGLAEGSSAGALQRWAQVPPSGTSSAA